MGRKCPMAYFIVITSRGGYMHRYGCFDKEILTEELALEYRDRALKIDNRYKQYSGKIRTIAEELRIRCGVTELEAINILNGNHIHEYVKKYDRRNNKFEIDEGLHERNKSLLQQEEEAADRRAMVDDGW